MLLHLQRDLTLHALCIRLTVHIQKVRTCMHKSHINKKTVYFNESVLNAVRDKFRDTPSISYVYLKMISNTSLCLQIYISSYLFSYSVYFLKHEVLHTYDGQESSVKIRIIRSLFIQVQCLYTQCQSHTACKGTTI